eukprot:2773278-Rhodomonas_salina.1
MRVVSPSSLSSDAASSSSADAFAASSSSSSSFPLSDELLFAVDCCCSALNACRAPAFKHTNPTTRSARLVTARVFAFAARRAAPVSAERVRGSAEMARRMCGSSERRVGKRRGTVGKKKGCHLHGGHVLLAPAQTPRVRLPVVRFPRRSRRVVILLVFLVGVFIVRFLKRTPVHWCRRSSCDRAERARVCAHRFP